jgi:hypothetical protein
MEKTGIDSTDISWVTIGRYIAGNWVDGLKKKKKVKQSFWPQFGAYP